MPPRLWPPRSPPCRMRAGANVEAHSRTRSSRTVTPSQRTPATSWSCWLENISARALLDRIVSGEPWTPGMADAAAEDPNLFRDLVEPLADAFDPRLADE